MIYCFCKRWVGVDVNLQTVVPEGGGGDQNQTNSNKRGEGSKFWSFCDIPVHEKQSMTTGTG